MKRTAAVAGFTNAGAITKIQKTHSSLSSTITPINTNQSPAHSQHTLSPISQHHDMSPIPYSQQVPSPITSTSPVSSGGSGLMLNNNNNNNNNTKYMNPHKYMTNNDISAQLYNPITAPGHLIISNSNAYSPVHSPTMYSNYGMSPHMISEDDVKLESMNNNHHLLNRQQQIHVQQQQQQLMHHHAAIQQQHHNNSHLSHSPTSIEDGQDNNGNNSIDGGDNHNHHHHHHIHQQHPQHHHLHELDDHNVNRHINMERASVVQVKTE